MEITEYTIEKMDDPFGILEGDRYECLLYAEVDEEDELFSPEGFYVRVLYVVTPSEEKAVSVMLHNRADGQVLDFDLEEDERDLAVAFVKKHLHEEEN